MILSFTSSKGGVGKSTSCAAIACALAAEGKVLVLDLDPNKTLASWQKRARFEGVTVEHCTTEDFAQAFRNALTAGTYAHVLIDLAGLLHTDILRAFARSDLVVIPAGASVPDLMEAVKTMQHVKKVGETLERSIPCRLLLTRLSPLHSKVGQYINEQVTTLKVAVFNKGMIERTAYKELFVTGKPPHLTDPKAAAEIADILAEIRDVIGKAGTVKPVRDAAA